MWTCILSIEGLQITRKRHIYLNNFFRKRFLRDYLVCITVWLTRAGVQLWLALWKQPRRVPYLEEFILLFKNKIWLTKKWEFQQVVHIYIHRSTHYLVLKNIQEKTAKNKYTQQSTTGTLRKTPFLWSALGKKYFVIFTGSPNSLMQSNAF